MRPSNSTYASVGIGVPLATIISWLFDAFLRVQMPGPVEAAFGAVISAAVGYFFMGGRATQTVAGETTTGQARSPWYASVIAFLIVIAVLLGGCSGTKAFYRQAQTPTQYAKAILEHHNAIGLQVATLLNNQGLSEQSKEKVRAGYRLTVCDEREIASGTPTASCVNGASYDLDAAIRAYESVANAQTDADLQAAVLALTPLVTHLINAIAGS